MTHSTHFHSRMQGWDNVKGGPEAGNTKADEASLFMMCRIKTARPQAFDAIRKRQNPAPALPSATPCRLSLSSHTTPRPPYQLVFFFFNLHYLL